MNNLKKAPVEDDEDAAIAAAEALAAAPAAQLNRQTVLDEYEKVGLGWVWATDAAGRLVYLSDKALDNLGHDDGVLHGKPFDALFEIDTEIETERTARPLTFQLKARTKIRDQVVRFSHETSAQNVRQKWWSISGYPLIDDAGNFAGYRGSARDVSAEYERKLIDSKLADFDSLTGLANRHNMNRHLDGRMAGGKSSGRTCALMMLDLDKFKHVNDTLGHQAGDSLLCQVAERLTAIAGKRGMVCRLGGDEFQVMLPDIDDRGELGEMADKIIQILSQPYPIDDKRAIIGASVGIAIAPFDGDTREDLIRAADLSLYAAKNGGRGQFRFYAADLKDEEQERQTMLDDLRLALEAEQLELYYQPVVKIENSTVVCLEALMRWEHPERGFVSPAVFIPVAEDSDLINGLGEWALRKACETALDWPKTVRVAVNVSAVQFANPGFPAVVANVLAQTGIEPDRLELELTESVFVGDTDAAEKTFKTLKGLGVRLALDDFGTGYSSLSYLRSAPFDKIKVDRSFVTSCTQQDKNSAKIIAAIVGLSNALNMETTVEGVEAFDQLDVVKQNGARMVQGYIYARPMPAEKVAERLASGDFRIEPEGPEQFRPDRRSVFRRIGIIHEEYYYDAVMRDLSRTGSGIEGLVGVPVGADLVLDLGGGQLIVCKVARSRGSEIGVEFESELVSDGAGGLCTRHRLSPYVLAQAGLPSAPGEGEVKANEGIKPAFMQVAVGASAKPASN
ncbi:putative bifunctional diguanylate cyclase/phosphodiesterase [Alteripontixanthobacter maritimus]|uniref:putative bifunctional diguanylate cyclase/phosphodiesterase n=1 Tax=Alteripontixanthobacter maritimus TaxID=2161824 RepID=UPI000E1B6DEB|nr:EAL domain-containing protein [Alteripontixanthobacter maritimus]